MEQQARLSLTRPTQDFVAPEGSAVIQMLHEGIVPLQSHAIYHPPFWFFLRVATIALAPVVVFVCVIRVLEARGRRMWIAHRPGAGGDGTG